MAGGLLPQTNDPMPNINKNIEGWGTDAAGTDLTVGDKYADLINIKGAKFLDLYNSSSVKIDDADDLKDALKEYDVEMSIAFNDNPDNDEFRKAYIVVITGLKEKTVTPVTPTGSGKVELLDKGMGSITNDNIEVLTNGVAYATFTLNTPNFVDLATAVAGKRLRFNWALEVDGKEAYRQTSYILDNSVLATGTITGNSDLDAFTVKELQVAGGSGQYSIPAGATSVKLVLRNVEWGEVAVKFVDKDGDPIHLSSTGAASSETMLTAFGEGGTTGAALSFNASADWYAASTIDFEIKGANNLTNSTKLSKTGVSHTPGTKIDLEPTGSDKFQAIGTSAVTVTVDKLTDLSNRTVSLSGWNNLLGTPAAFNLTGVALSTIDTSLKTTSATLEVKPTTEAAAANSYTGIKPGDKFTLEVSVGSGAMHAAVNFYTVEFDVVDSNDKVVAHVGPFNLISSNGGATTAPDGSYFLTQLSAPITAADTNMKVTNLKITEDLKNTVETSFVQDVAGNTNLATGTITLKFSDKVTEFPTGAITFAAGYELDTAAVGGAIQGVGTNTVALKVKYTGTMNGGGSTNDATLDIAAAALKFENGKALTAYTQFDTAAGFKFDKNA